MKKILVTGGSGYLGQHLVPRLSEGYDVLYSYHKHQRPLPGAQATQLDVRDSLSVQTLVNNWRPETIIHAAGSNRSPDMKKAICLGAENIRDAAKEVGARIIHISTDVIFDGTSAPYSESDPPNPIHAYGEAKAEAEETVSSYEHHVIIRTSLIYGTRIMDMSSKWIKEALDSGKEVTLFRDQIRNPVWTGTMCAAILELLENSFTGIINIAGKQVMSRESFGLKMLDWWGISDRRTLTVGLSGEKWPKDCRLDLSLAESVLETPMLGVDQVLSTAASFRSNK